MKKKHNRPLSLLLAFVMALTLLPHGQAARAESYSGFIADGGNGNSGSESYASLVDGSTQTKWYSGVKTTPPGENQAFWWVDFHAESAIRINGYSLTTGNDNTEWGGRNPSSWILKAKASQNSSWTVIASVTNDRTLEDKNFATYDFDLDTEGSWQYFRFMVSASRGASGIQLSELTLKYNAPARKPVKLEITTPPSKLEYTEGESFDPAGMVVKATYNDGSEEAVDGYSWQPNGALTTADTSVTVSFAFGGETVTAVQPITVKPLSAHILTGVTAVGRLFTNANSYFVSVRSASFTWENDDAPEQTPNFNAVQSVYTDEACQIPLTGALQTGEEYYLTAVVQNPMYDDHSIVFDKLQKKDCILRLMSCDTECVKITAESNHGFDVIRLVFKIKPKTLTEIAVTTPPVKVEYMEGESFVSAGMVVTATYSDNSTEEIEGYTYDPWHMRIPSDMKVTISYTWCGTTMTATQPVTITPLHCTLEGITAYLGELERVEDEGSGEGTYRFRWGYVKDVIWKDDVEPIRDPDFKWDYVYTDEACRTLLTGEMRAGAEYYASAVIKGNNSIDFSKLKKEDCIFFSDGFEAECVKVTAESSSGQDSAVAVIKLIPKALTGIAITGTPYYTDYVEGQRFNPMGMEVTATYSDGSTAKIRSYTLEPQGMLKASDTKITVSYTCCGVTKTAEQPITVKPYSEGDKFAKVLAAITLPTVGSTPVKTGVVVYSPAKATVKKVEFWSIDQSRWKKDDEIFSAGEVLSIYVEFDPADKFDKYTEVIVNSYVAYYQDDTSGTYRLFYRVPDTGAVLLDEDGERFETGKILRCESMSRSLGKTNEPNSYGYDPDQTSLQMILDGDFMQYDPVSLMRSARYERATQNGFVPLAGESEFVYKAGRTIPTLTLYAGEKEVMRIELYGRETTEGETTVFVVFNSLAPGAVRITLEGKEYLIVTPGDVNLDGTMNALDWITIMRWTLVASGGEYTSPNDEGFTIKVNDTQYNLWVLLADMTDTEPDNSKNSANWSTAVNAVDWITIMQLTLQAWK
ncbi:MAG: bacterial Ig-like domain-containing protein, partial [Clostridia bacterium]|nr:bacterial Ig-like domain-containing protein [Clostridia bacterium]